MNERILNAEKLASIRDGVTQLGTERANLTRQLDHASERRAQADAKLERVNTSLTETRSRKEQLEGRRDEFMQKVEQSQLLLQRLSANTEVKRSCLAAMTAGIESVEKSQDDDVISFEVTATEMSEQFQNLFNTHGEESLTQQLEHWKDRESNERTTVEEKRDLVTRLEEELKEYGWNADGEGEESLFFWDSVRNAFRRDYEITVDSAERRLKDIEELRDSLKEKHQGLVERLDEMQGHALGNSHQHSQTEE